MSLEDDRMGWKAAEQLERGLIPEAQAAHRAGALLRRFVASPYLTDEFWTEVGGKCVASRVALRTIFDDLDRDPARLREPSAVLRQQPVNEQDQYDWELEQAAIAKDAWIEHCANAERIRKRHVDEFDPDAREQDRENDRLREARQDEHAEAPRFAS